MNTKEKAIYLKGLADGLDFDRDSAEGKLLTALIDLCSEMAKDIEELESDTQYLNDYVEELDEDLGAVEGHVYDDDCCCCDDDDDDDDDDFCDGDCDCCDEDCCGIECPACGEMLHFSCDTKLEDLVCPKCGEKLAVIDEFEDEK